MHSLNLRLETPELNYRTIQKQFKVLEMRGEL